MVGTSKLCPTTKHNTAAVGAVEPLKVRAWQVAQPCVPWRERRTSLKSCSPSATRFGSNVSAVGIGVIGSSAAGAEQIQRGMRNAADAMYVHRLRGKLTGSSISTINKTQQERRTGSQHPVLSGSRAVRWRRFRACAEVAAPGRQYFDQRYLRDLVSPATIARGCA